MTKTTQNANPLSLSKEAYEEFTVRLDLYNKIAVGLRDVQEGRMSPAADVFARIRAGLHG